MDRFFSWVDESIERDQRIWNWIWWNILHIIIAGLSHLWGPPSHCPKPPSWNYFSFSFSSQFSSSPIFFSCNAPVRNFSYLYKITRVHLNGISIDIIRLFSIDRKKEYYIISHIWLMIGYDKLSHYLLYYMFNQIWNIIYGGIYHPSFFL